MLSPTLLATRFGAHGGTKLLALQPTSIVGRAPSVDRRLATEQGSRSRRDESDRPCDRPHVHPLDETRDDSLARAASAVSADTGRPGRRSPRPTSTLAESAGLGDLTHRCRTTRPASRAKSGRAVVWSRTQRLHRIGTRRAGRRQFAIPKGRTSPWVIRMHFARPSKRRISTE